MKTTQDQDRKDPISAIEKTRLLAEFAASLVTADQGYIVVVFNETLDEHQTQVIETHLCHNLSTGLELAAKAVTNALFNPVRSTLLPTKPETIQ